MDSSASISSLMRIAPRREVKPQPMRAANARATTMGASSRVLA